MVQYTLLLKISLILLHYIYIFRIVCMNYNVFFISIMSISIQRLSFVIS